VKVTKQELMEALLVEEVLKLNGGSGIVSISEAIAAAERISTLAEWRAAVEQMVEADAYGDAKSSQSESLFSRATAEARALKEQYLHDPYRSPAMRNITLASSAAD
jgi:hypothetical protein